MTKTDLPPLPTKPRISVALCTHNGAKYVGEQIESILAQTHPVNEVILGDDASTDATVQIICDAIRGTGIDLQIRPHNPALGVRDNFADAILATTGDVVFLCDQDDVWYPEKVETLLPYLETAQLVHSDARLVDGNGHPLGTDLLDELRATPWERASLENGDALPALLRRNLVTGATTATRGDFARAAMPVPNGLIHDDWLAILAAIDGRLRLCPKVLTDYRQHGGNQIGVKMASPLKRSRWLFASDLKDYGLRLDRAVGASQMCAERGLGSPEQQRLLNEAVTHHQRRIELPKGRWSRIAPIAQELRSGRYDYYSRGWRTAVRDFLQVR